MPAVQIQRQEARNAPTTSAHHSTLNFHPQPTEATPSRRRKNILPAHFLFLGVGLWVGYIYNRYKDFKLSLKIRIFINNTNYRTLNLRSPPHLAALSTHITGRIFCRHTSPFGWSVGVRSINSYNKSLRFCIICEAVFALLEARC